MNTSLRQDLCFPLLTDILLFRGMTSEQLGYLAADCHRRQAPKGQILCDKGAVLEGFYAVREGCVKLAMLSAEGAERVVQIVLAGEVFGEEIGLSGQPAIFYAQTLCDSQLLFFRAERVRALLARWPSLGMLFFAQSCLRIQELYRDLEACCLQTALQRVAGYLLDALASRRCPEYAGDAYVRLPAGKAVVASRLNLTPETFSRELRQLSRLGVIQVERRLVHVLSLERLRAAAARD